MTPSERTCVVLHNHIVHNICTITQYTTGFSSHSTQQGSQKMTVHNSTPSHSTQQSHHHTVHTMKQRGMCCANNNCYHLLMNSFSLCWGSQKMKLLLLEEKYLELLEEGETLSALHCLRHEIVPLAAHSPEKRVQDLTRSVDTHSLIFSCPSLSLSPQLCDV